MTDSFWSTRPVLEHVLQLARARRAGPWATLAAALGRAATTVPPHVTLPSIIGGRQSLNLFVAFVGASGAGKGAAEAAAAEGIKFSSGFIDPVPLGSGEGVARTFRPAGTKSDEPNPVTTALFSAPEVDSLSALASRSGSTLSAELRKLYSGEPIGFANAGKDTRNVVAGHSYRGVFFVGLQPLRSDALLAGADGGLPQRFVFAIVSDPDAPTDAPDDPGVWSVKVPAWTRTGAGHLAVVDCQPRDLIVPDRAVTEIRTHRLAVLREDPDVDPLDGHRLLTQLKVAAAFMALDGRTVVGDEDWTLAATLMERSASTRDMCRRAMRNHLRTINTARALATADRDEVVSDRRLQRAKQAIVRWLGKEGELPARELRPKLKADIRVDFGAAVAELAAEGAIVEIEVANGVRYRLTDQVHAVPGVQPPNAQLRGAVPEVQRVPGGNVSQIENRRLRTYDTARPSCREWFNAYIQSLRDAGKTTAESLAVYAAGEAAGYSRATLYVAANRSPIEVIENRTSGGATWRITTTEESSA